MLARYSSQFVVARELIQNADDAGASKFTLALTVGADLQLLELKAENNGTPPRVMLPCVRIHSRCRG